MFGAFTPALICALRSRGFFCLHRSGLNWGSIMKAVLNIAARGALTAGLGGSLSGQFTLFVASL